MKLFKSETAVAFFSSIVILYLVIFPILCDIQISAAEDRYPPVIAHKPVTTARYGDRLTLRAHIGDRSPLRTVYLVLIVDGTARRGKMKESASRGVPVVGRVRSETRVYAGPGTRYQFKGALQPGVRVKVAGVNDSYYEIITQDGRSGFASSKTVEVLGTGSLFSVTLPESFTRRSALTYQIEAIDAAGNKTATEAVQIRFTTSDQPGEFREDTFTDTGQAVRGSAEQISRPFYKRIWFWMLLLAAGGGAYYYISQNQDDSPQGTVDVLVEWE